MNNSLSIRPDKDVSKMTHPSFSFLKVNECKVGNKYDANIFLTFDIDWACDEVLFDTIEMIENAKVSATWFVTHKTPLLERLRANTSFEIGIHPNFNPLLDGNHCNGRCAEEVIDQMLEIAPEARSVRCHSLVQSSKLVQLFIDKNITHDCNHFIPEQSNMTLLPWMFCNRIIKIPYFWEDDVVFSNAFNTPLSELLRRGGLKVFDFHPIHVFLNTENFDRYERTRDFHHNPSELIKHRFEGIGTRNHLLELLDLAKASTYQDGRLK